MFKEFNEKNVFITGHTGFKGSWLSIWLHNLGAKITGYALDPKNKNDNFLLSKISDKINLKYVEKEVLLDNIDSMDEAFICSSVVGVLPCFWDNWKSDFILTKRLQFLLEESLQK